MYRLYSDIGGWYLVRLSGGLGAVEGGGHQPRGDEAAAAQPPGVFWARGRSGREVSRGCLLVLQSINQRNCTITEKGCLLAAY